MTRKFEKPNSAEMGGVKDVHAAVARREDATDQQLVYRARSGDEGAFTELYRQNAPWLARRLESIVGSSQEVDDIMQSTFFEAFRTLPRLREGVPFAAWVRSIAFNITGRYLRGRQRRAWLRLGVTQAVDDWQDTKARTAEQQTADRQLLVRLYKAMDMLPAKQRIAFALHEIDEMKLAEIGEVVGASAQTVWARVQSARARIQRQFAKEDEL